MNEPPTIAKLVPNKPDADLAIELKADLAEAASEWLNACTRANKCGFQVQASFGPDPFGKYTIQTLNLVKVF